MSYRNLIVPPFGLIFIGEIPSENGFFIGKPRIEVSSQAVGISLFIKKRPSNSIRRPTFMLVAQNSLLNDGSIILDIYNIQSLALINALGINIQMQVDAY